MCPSAKPSNHSIETMARVPHHDRELMSFSELVRMLEQRGFTLIREKGSIRYYAKPGIDRLIRVDYHGSREVPASTCHAILKAAGIKSGDKP
jgi:predicted RNA binding protein YcfA (HicA-like mRNA interferase family)